MGSRTLPPPTAVAAVAAAAAAAAAAVAADDDEADDDGAWSGSAAECALLVAWVDLVRGGGCEHCERLGLPQRESGVAGAGMPSLDPLAQGKPACSDLDRS